MLYRPIAVFDSGLGSLSVVRELRKIIPSENILYFADKMNFPYGNKTKSELKSIILKSIKFFYLNLDNGRLRLLIYLTCYLLLY